MPTIQQLVRKGRETLVVKGKSPALDSCSTFAGTDLCVCCVYEIRLRDSVRV